MLLQTPESPELKEAAPLADLDSPGHALCKALRGLTDATGHITAEGLCGAGGLDEGVLVALELRVGPGPWPVALLEALLAEIFAGSGAGDDVCGAGKIAADLPVIPAQWCRSDKAQWRTPELQQLEDAVDEALRVEDMGAVQVLDEPESEHPLEVEVLEAGILRLQQVAASLIVDPILEGPCGPEEDLARQMLPGFADDVLAMLRKTWRLARIRGQQVRQLQERLMTTTSEAGRTEEVQELLEGTVSRLAAMKRAAKEKDWELAEARRKIDQLEGERAKQERKLRQLETASQRETHARGEAERRLAEAQSEREAEATEHEEGLRRRLASAEAELVEVAKQEEELRGRLMTAEEELVEACMQRDHRTSNLTSELSESQHLVQELQQRVQDTSMDDPLSAGAPAGGKKHRRRSEGNIGNTGGGHERPHRLSLPSRAALDVVQEEVAPSSQAPPQHLQRKASKQSARSDAGSTGGGAAAVPPIRGLALLMGGPPAGDQGAQALGRPKNLNSLPMDLRGLGKLLTGGGVTPRQR